MDELIRQIKPYTKSSYERMGAMVAAAKNAAQLPGDIVECGVWRGGNIILARKTAPNKICWLYDTFAGMTEPKDCDVSANGYTAMASYKAKNGAWIVATVEEVQANLVDCGVYDSTKLKFIKGPVEQTLLYETNLPKQISLLRLDTDWHDSTKIELEVLYPRLVKGGILIVDDYGHWMGARMAVDNFFGKKMPPMAKIDYTAIAIVKG